MVEALDQTIIHLWHTHLDASSEEVALLEQTLSSDERERAARFRFEQDVRRFIVGRGRLRTLLSRYTGVSPQALRFRYGPHGKPLLASVVNHEQSSVPSLPQEEYYSTLSFNLSHANELALYAVTTACEIGIDLERLQSIPNVVQIAQTMLAPAESDALLNIPAEQKDTAFLRCWVRKEAYLKAGGGGLSLPLDKFAVSLDEGSNAGLVYCESCIGEATQWRFLTWHPTSTYLAAVTARVPSWQVIHCGDVTQIPSVGVSQ